MKAILASSYREYWNYIRDNNLDQDDAVYIFCVDNIRGRRFTEVIKYGTWYINKFYNEEFFWYLNCAIENKDCGKEVK